MKTLPPPSITAQKDARRPLSYRHYTRRLLSYSEPRLGRNGRRQSHLRARGRSCRGGGMKWPMATRGKNNRLISIRHPCHLSREACILWDQSYVHAREGNGGFFSRGQWSGLLRRKYSPGGKGEVDQVSHVVHVLSQPYWWDYCSWSGY